MTLADIARVTADFAAAARRAREAGFEWLELHFAHGYLAQSFFSAYSNQRDDAYGGSAAKRGRFLLETLTLERGAGEILGDDLQGDLPPEAGIAGPIDDAHATPAEQPEDLEMADSLGPAGGG